MDIQRNIKYNLTAVMKKANMSLTEFAEELGIARSSLQHYLNGTSNPRADTIQLIADKLDIPVEALVSSPDLSPKASSRNFYGKLKDINLILKKISDDCYKLHLDCLSLSQMLLEESGHSNDAEED